MNCTGCGMGLMPGVRFCTRCGTPAPAPGPVAAPSNFCTTCGNTLQGKPFCTRCGAPAGVAQAGGSQGSASGGVLPMPGSAPSGYGTAPAPQAMVRRTGAPVMPPEYMPDYRAAADIVGARFDPVADQLFRAAVGSMGGQLEYEEEFARWVTWLVFPDERKQRVFLYLEEPNQRAAGYLGGGHLLATVASSAGPDTGVVDHWMVFRRAAHLYLTRVVSDKAPWGATLRVRGSLLLSTATPGQVASMILEAGAEADVLEESIFGAAVDDD